MYCVRCGAAMQPGQGFCDGCGKPTGSVPLMPVQSRLAGHMRLLAIFWFAISAFRLIPGLVLLTMFGPDGRFLPADVPGFVNGILQMVGYLFIGGAVVGLLAGWGLLERQPWARMLAIVLACFSLLDMPFGRPWGSIRFGCCCQRNRKRSFGTSRTLREHRGPRRHSPESAAYILESQWDTIENVVVSHDASTGRRGQLNLVPKIAESADQFAGALSDCLGVRTLPPFFVADTLIQDLPRDPAKSMGNSPYCFEVSNSPGQTAVKSLIGTAFGVDCGVGRLVENAPHVAIALGRTVAPGDFGALFPAWTTPNPRGHLARRRKRGGVRTLDPVDSRDGQLIQDKVCVRLRQWSAMICWAESAPRPGTPASLWTESPYSRKAWPTLFSSVSI
jgi:hypothetical protein